MARKEIDSNTQPPKRKAYEKELRRLQAELCKLQDWVKYKGLRIIVVLEDVTRPEKVVRFARSPSA